MIQSIFPLIFVIHTISIQSQMESYIVKNLPHRRTTANRTQYARQLTDRIMIESKRRNLDPIALLAVAKIESNFLHYVSRKPDDSHGIWQIIRYQKSTVYAAKTLAGCNYDHLKSRYWRLFASVWSKRIGSKQCEDQTIADHRTRSGPFSISELKTKDHVVSTYIAAREIRQHIDNCRHSHIILGCKLPLKEQNRLAKYGHFNSGSRKLRWYYISRLCKYYREIKNGQI